MCRRDRFIRVYFGENFLSALLPASIVAGMAEEGVQVAVRVRPFAGYEKDANANCCVRMDGAQTIVTDPETGKAKPFTFDYSYNSFVDKDDPGYASNDTVYNDLGHGVGFAPGGRESLYKFNISNGVATGGGVAPIFNFPQTPPIVKLPPWVKRRSFIPWN